MTHCSTSSGAKLCDQTEHWLRGRQSPQFKAGVTMVKSGLLMRKSNQIISSRESNNEAGEVKCRFSAYPARGATRHHHQADVTHVFPSPRPAVTGPPSPPLTGGGTGEGGFGNLSARA